MRAGRVLHHQEGQTRSMDARALRTTSDSFLPLCMQQDLGCQELLGEEGGWEPELQAQGNLWPVRGLTDVHILGRQMPGSRTLVS